MADDKEIKIVFEPGCFDSFDGTQEELDALMAEIQRLIESGEIFDSSTLVTDEEEIPEWIAEIMMDGDPDARRKKLN